MAAAQVDFSGTDVDAAIMQKVTSTIGVQAVLSQSEPQNPKGAILAEEESSKLSSSESDNEDDSAVSFSVVAEVQEKLCAAMHHYNQYRRLDTKVVAKYTFQLYRFITCIAWLMLPTVASFIASYIVDLFLVDDPDLRKYKNVGLVSANSFLWVYGLYTLRLIWLDLMQSSNELQCLSDKRWMYEERFIQRLLSHGFYTVQEKVEEQENQVLEQDVEQEGEKGPEGKIEAGAAGDVATPKDKDV